jgi:hypothetical protein
MKFIKILFCKHHELKLLTPLEVNEHSMYAIFICQKCGKEIFKRVNGNFLS